MKIIFSFALVGEKKQDNPSFNLPANLASQLAAARLFLLRNNSESEKDQYLRALQGWPLCRLT